ncbi:VP91 [Alphabaculovirus myunipunctae]|uniref:VP91 n=1 Tax=Mythimna unipuncta nucleopolyhedrovirus TaxID=447897 RepID=A0A2K9VSD8_9ABAC|nr:VP91 [Mythimna unipuncta nucleopolyhedrovirus]AUV65356.1 VP91 [Mythimna unipuncta nucleopolyhedrovirus]
MSTVLLLLVAIVLIIIFSILYLIIQSEFDENQFENKLRVVTEYSKRTNAEHPLPPILRYVSEVDSHSYIVRTINTANLAVLDEEVHDDRIETFNFLTQTFQATYENAEQDADTRVRADATDPSKYAIRGDDGWMEVDCPFDEHFNESTMRCEPIAPCYGKTPGNYGLTERMIDALVLHHRVPRPGTGTGGDDDDDSPSPVHPTMYLRCLHGGSHVVDECPSNHLYDDVTSQCVLRNDCQDRPDDFLLPIFPESLTINEYMVCKNGEPTVVSCPFGKIFDRRLLMCVDAEPCSVHGEGYTYITDDIGPTQFYQCLSPDSKQLVTCINRVFVNDRYECAGDVECVVFENGTGTQLRTYDDDVWTYNTGALVCDNYRIVENTECDNENLLDGKRFNNLFYVSVYVPREMYDAHAKRCVPFDRSRVTTKSDIYQITNDANDVGVEFETTIVGETEHAMQLLTADRLDHKVLYARDIGAMGINFVDGTTLDCFGDHLYNPFSGTQLNRCVDEQLEEKIVIDENLYFVPSRAAVVDTDDDYVQSCAKQMNTTTNYIELDHFTTRILANILRNDPCDTILSEIHAQYTTIHHKYTTISLKYTTLGVKTPIYIERYGTNIRKNTITISPESGGDDADGTNDPDSLKPIFDPFERYEIIEPTFNPWSDDVNGDDDVNGGGDEDDGGDDVNGGSDGGDDDSSETLPPPPPPPPPELTLTDKQLDYTCFYTVPTFKLTACNVDDDHIVESIRKLRDNVRVEPECDRAAGLANVLNSYAYLGDGVGCRSVFRDNSIAVVVSDGKTFTNLDTQSNDGVQYNKWVHAYNGTFMACPDHALLDDFTCRLEDDKLYYMEDLQK